MMKKTVLFLLFFLATMAAQADSRIDRMEVIGEEISQLMYEVMIDEIAANGVDVTRLRAMIPDTSWDQPMREATGCIIDKYEQKIGAGEIDKMIARMEATLPELRKGGGMEVLDKASSMQPEGISDQEAISISQSCGMMQLMQEKAMAGDFMTEVMKLMNGG